MNFTPNWFLSLWIEMFCFMARLAFAYAAPPVLWLCHTHRHKKSRPKGGLYLCRFFFSASNCQWNARNQANDGGDQAHHRDGMRYSGDILSVSVLI